MSLRIQQTKGRRRRSAPFFRGEGRPLDVRVFQELRHLNAESDADALERPKRQIHLTTLDSSVVGAVHSDFVRETFLAHAQGLSAPTQGVADSFREDPILHGMRTLRLP